MSRPLRVPRVVVPLPVCRWGGRDELLEPCGVLLRSGELTLNGAPVGRPLAEPGAEEGWGLHAGPSEKNESGLAEVAKVVLVLKTRQKT